MAPRQPRRAAAAPASPAAPAAPAAPSPAHVAQERLLRVAILFLTAALAFAIRLSSVLKFERVIHEFDPYFNYRATKYLATEGFVEFWNWFDGGSWYPLGRAIGGTVYPGLMWTAAAIHHALHALTLTVALRDVAVFTAPLFAAATTLVAYFLGTEVSNRRCGLLAAALLAIVPGYISRSVAGSFDNEGVAIFALLLTFFLFVRAVNTGSLCWSCAAALGYFYMVSAWGGYVFIINLLPIYVLTLLGTGRYSPRLYVAYSSFYALGTMLAMQIRFVGFQPVQSSEHILAMATFAILQLHAGLLYVQKTLSKSPAAYAAFQSAALKAAGVAALAVAGAALATGAISPWTGRFYNLLDPSFARRAMPIIASVSEHQPTSWASFMFDLHILCFLFPTGLYYCFKELSNAKIFLVLYGVFSLYFAGVMVRLMLVLAPAACLVAAVALEQIISTYVAQLLPPAEGAAAVSIRSAKKRGRMSTLPVEKEFAYLMLFGVTALLLSYVRHCAWVSSEAYSAPSIVLSASGAGGKEVIFDDFRESYQWLRQNTAPDARIMSWWDYGYQITAMANRTVLVDNNTWNNTHIATVGMAFASTEEEAYDVMQHLGVDYVLVVFGGLTGYTSDDINKMPWIIRIANSVFPAVQEEDFLTAGGKFVVDKKAPASLFESLLYKLCYFRFGAFQTEYGKAAGFDRARSAEIGAKDFELDYVEEAYTSSNWIVRIYKVPRNPGNRW